MSTVHSQTSRIAGAGSDEMVHSRRSGIRTAVIVLLCAVAGLRVFVYGAAFPFFNNVDEEAHFDLVCKYSHGRVPTGLEETSRESAELIATYGSPEYFGRVENAESGTRAPSPWTRSPAEIERVAAALRRNVNHEATEPPVYYALAGAWYALGKAVGLRGGDLLYWVRFLDVPLIALLVWLAHGFLAKLYPESPFLHLGVPFLLAFFPQDVYYSISNDVLSAVLGGAAFYSLLALHGSDSKGHAACAFAGLLAAGAFLVKFSNVVILAILALVLMLEAIRLHRAAKLAHGWPKLATALAAAALPIGAWLVRNRMQIGDWSGSEAKIASLGWTAKPLGELPHHPIFTARGFAHFWSETAATFWNGEFTWDLARMSTDASDRFYSWSSAVFVAVSSFALLASWRRTDRSVRFANGMSLFFCAGALLFLVWVSIAFDFGACWHPSRELPYMTSGRLALGALVPFLTLYLAGLERILSWAGIARYRWIALGGIAAWITLSEAALSRAAFGSVYNWFHLP